MEAGGGWGLPGLLEPWVDTQQWEGVPWEGEETPVPGENSRSAPGCPFAGTEHAANKCLLDYSEFPKHGDIQKLSPSPAELLYELTH